MLRLPIRPWRTILYSVPMHPVLFHLGVFIVSSSGAATALGILLALGLAPRTARQAGADPAKLWNLCVLSLAAAIATPRLQLIAENWRALRIEPAEILALSAVHRPAQFVVGALAGILCAALYSWRAKLPPGATADALAPLVAVGMAWQQLGALASGAGYGREAGSGVRWAVTYTDAMAAIWSGTPLGIPLCPVQLAAALAFFALAVLLLLWLPLRRQRGDVAGAGLMGAGVTVYFTEFWRDPQGHGWFFRGTLDGPQIAAILLLVVGALTLRERKAARNGGDENAAPGKSAPEEEA